MSGPGGLFNQTFSFRNVVGRSGPAGDPSGFSATATAKGRIQPSRRLVRNSAGNEVMSTHVLYTSAPVTLKSRFWFPGDVIGDPEAARRPIGVDEHVDGRGVLVFKKVTF